MGLIHLDIQSMAYATAHVKNQALNSSRIGASILVCPPLVSISNPTLGEWASGCSTSLKMASRPPNKKITQMQLSFPSQSRVADVQ